MVSRFFFVFGFILILLGTILILIEGFVPGGSISTGGILLIGPVPIIFGSGPMGQVLALLAIALTIAVLTFAFLREKNRDAEQKGQSEAKEGDLRQD